jgi:hypothetical protein
MFAFIVSPLIGLVYVYIYIYIYKSLLGQQPLIIKLLNMTNLLDWVIRDLWLFLPTKIPILAGVVIGCIDKLWITTKHEIDPSNPSIPFNQSTQPDK